MEKYFEIRVYDGYGKVETITTDNESFLNQFASSIDYRFTKCLKEDLKETKKKFFDKLIKECEYQIKRNQDKIRNLKSVTNE